MMMIVDDTDAGEGVEYNIKQDLQMQQGLNWIGLDRLDVTNTGSQKEFSYLSRLLPILRKCTYKVKLYITAIMNKDRS